MTFKTVRGMQDFLPERASKKKRIEDTCRRVFESYGFAPLETPVVEEFSLLAKKGTGGEAVKDEIYYFKDKGDRELGLRFDLTVPLARVAAANPQLARPFKRYAIGRVYRYDRPQAKRYREFTQADIDILGVKGLAADFEIISVVIDAMLELGFKEKEFKVKINSRPLLEEIAICCKVKKENIIECFRCLDKMDKIGKEGVRKELGSKKISADIIAQVDKMDLSALNVKNQAPLEEMQALIKMLAKNKLGRFVEMNFGLARGLEYYTGMVFEVKLKDGPSVGGGGRYDKLVENYGGQATPAVGFSFGVERLLNSLEERMESRPAADIFLIALGEKATGEAPKIASSIRQFGLKCETDLLGRGIGKSIQYADKKGIPFVAILGDNELGEGNITIKNLKTGKQQKVRLKALGKLSKIVAKN